MDNLPTKREWLVQRGLAKAGVVGRFSNDAKAALAKAEAEGVKFAEDQPKPASAPRIPTQKATKVVITEPYEPKAVRVWAAKQGINLGERGRIPAPIVAQYLKETEGTRSEVPTASIPEPAKVKETVRPETVAWARSARPEGVGEHVIEPLVSISSCGRCGEGISYCRCSSGPYVPSFLTNGNADVQAMLVKPTV